LSHIDSFCFAFRMCAFGSRYNLLASATCWLSPSSYAPPRGVCDHTVPLSSLAQPPCVACGSMAASESSIRSALAVNSMRNSTLSADVGGGEGCSKGMRSRLTSPSIAEGHWLVQMLVTTSSRAVGSRSEGSRHSSAAMCVGHEVAFYLKGLFCCLLSI